LSILTLILGSHLSSPIHSFRPNKPTYALYLTGLFRHFFHNKINNCLPPKTFTLSKAALFILYCHVHPAHSKPISTTQNSKTKTHKIEEGEGVHRRGRVYRGGGRVFRGGGGCIEEGGGCMHIG